MNTKAIGRAINTVDGEIGKDGVVANKVSGPIPIIKADLFVFTCSIVNAIPRISEKLSPGSVFVYNHAGRDGFGAVDEQESAAMSVVMNLIANGSLEEIVEDAQRHVDLTKRYKHKGGLIHQGDKVQVIRR